MKTKLTIVLLLSIIYSAKAQIDSAFWNPQITQLAESNSTNGWVKIKSEKRSNSQTFFVNNKDAFGLTGIDSMEYVSDYTDELGLIHYKFQHLYKGIKVEGCEYILHEADGSIISANGKLACNLSQETIPSIKEASALNLALQNLNATKYGWEEVKNEDGECK